MILYTITWSYFSAVIILLSLFKLGKSIHVEEVPSLCAAQINDSSPVESGVCVSVRGKITFCPPLYRLFREGKWETLKQHYCHEQGTNLLAKVCCPLRVYYETPIQEKEPDYRDHKNFKLLPIHDCGNPYQPFTSPAEVKPGSFPWMARLEFTDFKKRFSHYACGGTLINKRYVMTAAHCFRDHEYRLKNVRLAENDEGNATECITTPTSKCVDDCNNPQNHEVVACTEAQDFKPEEIIVHPDYEDSPGSLNDIALIRLSVDVNITSYFTRPICLPFLKVHNNEDEIEDAKLIQERRNGEIAGWGRVSNEQLYGSSILKYREVPLVPNVICQLTHRNNTIDKSQLCAGGVMNQDPCIGDSGSPLVYTAFSHLDGKMVQRKFQLGIVSYGRTRCGLGEVPVVYTRVGSYLSWILNNLRP